MLGSMFTISGVSILGIQTQEIRDVVGIAGMEVYDKLIMCSVIFGGISIGIGVALAGYIIHHLKFNEDAGCSSNQHCQRNEHASVM